MGWPVSGNRRAERRSRPMDAVFESYVRWRQACEDTRAAYDVWRKTAPPGRRVAFAAYHAALDGEEYAARVHAELTGHARAQMAT